MSRVVDIEAARRPPLPAEVLRGEGIPADAPVSGRVVKEPAHVVDGANEGRKRRLY